jgi:hypothetical protein
MKLKALALVAAVAGAAALSSCETMTAEQCAAADWGALGHEDAARQGYSRFEERAESCADKGIAADASAYRDGFDSGMYVFCQPPNGFAFARRGGQFSGACPAELQEEFGYAYSDGQRVRAAEQALEAARSEIGRLIADREEIDDNIDSHEGSLREATTDEERQRHRDEIARLQRERRNVNDDLRVAQAQIPPLQRAVDDLRYEIGGRWGNW